METESGKKSYLGSKVGPSMLGKLLGKCHSILCIHAMSFVCVCVCMHEYVGAILLHGEAEFRLVNCE